MNDFTYVPEAPWVASPTFGKITHRVPDTCVNCDRPFNRPLLDLRGRIGSRIVGGEWSTKICPACQDIICHGEKPSRANREPRVNWDVICPPKYANVDLDLLPPAGREKAAEVLSWAAEAARHPSNQGLGLIGPSDHGKSMLIHLVAKGFHVAGFQVHVTFATQFAIDMSKQGGARNTELDRCCESPWLVMDDIGKEKMTERVEADFFHVLEVRERWGRPLLCTANTKGAELADNMSSDRGLPIVNRLKRLCHFIAV